MYPFEVFRSSCLDALIKIRLRATIPANTSCAVDSWVFTEFSNDAREASTLSSVAPREYADARAIRAEFGQDYVGLG